MLKAHSSQFSALLFACDVALSALVFAVASAHWQRPLIPPGIPLSWGLVGLGVGASLLFPLALDQVGLYQPQRTQPAHVVLPRLLLTGAASIAVLVVGAAVLAPPGATLFALVCGLAQVGVVSGFRTATYVGLGLLRRLGRNYRELVIVGSGPRAADFLEELELHPEWGLRVVAFVDDEDVPLDERVDGGLLHKLSDFPELLRERVVDEVVLACPRSLLPMAVPVVASCAEVGVPVTMLADVFGDHLPTPRVTRFGTLGALSFAQVHHSRLELASKRLVDLGIGGLTLVAFAPLMAATALAIRLTSPGPVLFRQTRCGLNGRRFEMLKFRSMYADAEERQAELADRNEMDGPVFKIRNDPRITPLGAFLRRTSIDELPQLWNVLRGDMSLVGPRPPVPDEVAQYHPAERRRLSMRPGLTCLWQVSGRNEIGFADWVKLDLQYIDGWSLALDLWILARTPTAVLRRHGAS